MGKVKDIMEYLYSVEDKSIRSEGVINLLSDITPESKVRAVEKLHNIVHTCFYDGEETAFELMITFDPKKVNVLAIDNIHKDVENVLYRKNKYFGWFVMREFGQDGIGRVHYHGLIKQIRGGQTEMAKLQAYLKITFGRMSYIRHIREPDRYIAYMLKRHVQEGRNLIREYKSSYMIKQMIQDSSYDDTKRYTWGMLKDMQKGHKIRDKLEELI